MAQKDPGRDPVADLAHLKDTNDRAIALTEALLLLSRAGNAIAEPEIVDLSLLADEAVETLLPLAEKITRAHHGVLHLAPRHGGGVIARTEFPAS